MKRKPPTPPAKTPAPRPEAVSEPAAGADGPDRIVLRPDGYHWLAPDGRQEFGPFETVDAAQADMEATDEGPEPDAADALLEAERDIGIADWIDPETGEPAEGQSPPHFEQE